MINSAQIVIISYNKSAKKTGTLANLQLFIAEAITVCVISATFVNNFSDIAVKFQIYLPVGSIPPDFYCFLIF
jgi:hypothetical protein